MIDLFQPIPLTGDLNSANNATAGPVGYTFTQSDGAQIQNTGSMDNASSQGTANVVAGPSANATGGGSTALGQQSTVAGGNSTGVGQGTSVMGGGSVVVGAQSNTSGSNDVVVGSSATGGSGGNNVVIGVKASARPNNSFLSTVIGANAVVGGLQGTVVGSDSSASGANSTVVGSDCTVSGGNSTAIGEGNIVSSGNALAIGAGNNVSGNSSTTIGAGNTVTHTQNFIFGNGIASGNNNQFVFGLDGTQPPVVTGAGAILHHADGNYTFLVLTNTPSATPNNGAAFNLSVKNGVECAIGANKVGSGAFTPLNFYTSATLQFAIDTSGRPNFMANNETGLNTPSLGSNAPTAPTAQPHAWVKCMAADGTLCTFPIWAHT